MVSSSDLVIPLPSNIFPDKIEFNVPINKSNTNNPIQVPINPHFCYYASFSIVSLTASINKPDSSGYLTIFIMPFISLFENINFVILGPITSLRISPAAADAAVNLNCKSALLASHHVFN